LQQAVALDPNIAAAAAPKKVERKLAAILAADAGRFGLGGGWMGREFKMPAHGLRRRFL
jgi:hypothetical protein